VADIIGQILMEIELSGEVFAKSTKISNLMKIRPVDAQLFRTDKRDEAKMCFSLFFEGV
jgi:hypothetical protein